MRDDIRRFLHPRTVAVIGASEDSSKFGGRVLEYLLKFGFAGTIVPVNKRAQSLRGLRAFPSLADFSGEIDVAIMAVPAADAVAAIRDCANARACILISAQFAEVGGEGVRRQAEAVAAARERGMRLLGPNCLGFVNPLERIAMSSTLSLSAISALPEGSIGLVSQSGALMGSMIAVGEAMGAGFSVCVSVGNQCDLEISDFVEYLAEDPATRVICLYVEGLLTPARFLAAVDRAHRNGKPVLLAKSGRTDPGAQAVKSHTASMAGSQAALRAVCEARGVVLVDDFFDMLAVAHCLSRLGRLQGDGIALMSGSGGGGALLVDTLAESGLRLARLGEAARARLADFLPGTHRHLPIDLGAMRQKVGQQEYRDAGRRLAAVVMADPDVAAGLLLLTTQPDMDDVARTVVEVGTACGKPLLLVNAGGRAGAGARAITREARYPSFDHPLEAVRAIGYLVRDFELRVPVAPPLLEPLALEGVLAALPRALLNEREAKQLLAAAGVPVTRERLARDAEEAVGIARDIGFPVALKAQARGLTHKSDVGGVVLGLASEQQVREAFFAVAHRVKASVGLDIEGCLVQEMVAAEVEIIVGSRWDEQFGSVLLVGFGGTLVELLQDVKWAPAPVTASAAADLLRSLKLARLLEGYRGRPRVNLDAAAAVIAQISQLAASLGDRLSELDANPVLVGSDRAVVADARAVLTGGA